MESSIDASEKDVKTDTQKLSLYRYIRHKPKAMYDGYDWRVKLDGYDIFLDRWIRGRKHNGNTRNKHDVRYDEVSHRWYLRLSALDVKEIRAKVWQYQLDKE